MADYTDVATRKAVDSTVVRVYPSAVVNIYTAGTANLITSVTADVNGYWSVPTLVDGFYDVKVDGIIVKSFHHVKYAHNHKDENWNFFHVGGVSVDSEANGSRCQFVASEAGSIVSVKLVSHNINATGDATAHLVKGAANGASNITFAANSVWSHRIFPAATRFRYRHIDNAPGISLAVDDVVAMAIDFTATTVDGIFILAKFRPTTP